MFEQEESYLRAELAVSCNHGYFNDSHDEHDTDNTEEAKYVVIATLVLPQVLEHEKQLYKKNCKRNQAGQQGTCRAAQIPWLGWDLTRNGVGLQRMLPRFRSHIAHPATDIHQGNLD